MLIHNLRSTLDHLAYALVERCNRSTFRQGHVFPDFRYRAKDFPKPVARKQYQAFGRFCYQTLDGIQPYEGRVGTPALATATNWILWTSIAWLFTISHGTNWAAA